MNNEKGFTMIKLVAVIIIISVVALITAPIVLNVIESAEKQAYRNSSLGVLRAAELYETENKFITIDKNGISVSDLQLRNNIFIGGKIIRSNNDKLQLVNLTNGVYC